MLNIDDYYITYNNSRDNAGMEVLCDDETLKDALQHLGENERLEIKLCLKKLHDQTSPVLQRHTSSPTATQSLRYSHRKSNTYKYTYIFAHFREPHTSIARRRLQDMPKATELTEIFIGSM